MKDKAKTDVFRPTIPDESGALRREFAAALKKSMMTRSAFSYKVFKAGIQVMNKRAEARP